MDLKQEIREIEYSFEFDQRELAKMLLLVSTTILIFAVQGITSLSSTSEDLQTLEEDFSQVSGMVNSEEFNNTVSALEDVQQGSISERMQFAAQSFRGLQGTSTLISDSSTGVENLLRLYQWLFLISLLGEVAGVSLIYM